MKKKIITVGLIIVYVVILILINIILKNQNNQTNNDLNKNVEEEIRKMEIIKVSSEDFEKEVLQSEKPVLIDFYAEWCGPCKMLTPTVEEIANENTNIKVVKVNIDEAHDIAVKYDIMSIPTLLFIRNGQEVDRVVGYVGKDIILNMIK